MLRRWSVLFTAALLLSPAAASPEPWAVEAKRRQIGDVVAELRSRDASHLTEAQRASRARVLNALEAYAVRGVFPENDRFPGREIPYFIDRHGTRCAVAHMMDVSGAGPLVERLAATDNHAFLAHVKSDPAIAEWLGTVGLSLLEAAYIQAPGLVDDGRQLDWSDTDSGALPTVPDTGGSPEDVPTPRDTTATTTRPRGGGSSVADWERWWHLNRDSFLNLRERYHEGRATTQGAGDTRPRRPAAADVEARLLPFLETMAADEEVRATALMAWARASGATADRSAAATLKYLGDASLPWRDLMLLALGLAPSEEARAALRAVVRDDGDGRAVLGRRTPVPARRRAFAAIALGQAGDAAATDDLLAILAKRGKDADLKAAAVTALGMLAERAPERRDDIAAALLRGLDARSWADAVRAAVPLALLRKGTKKRREAVLRVVAKFNGTDEVGQSAALALGLEGTLDAATVDALVAVARRDPDDAARRFAIVALGQLSSRHDGAAPDEKLLNKLVRFHSGGAGGIARPATDRPWHFLSAALFARRFDDHRPAVSKLPLAAARDEGSAERRAAAVVALGVLGDPASVPELAKLFGDARDEKVRAYLAEARGLLRDRSAREDLLKAVEEDPSPTVRYRAALGLGFLADSEVTGRLVAALAETNSRPVQAAGPRGIGESGDQAAEGGLREAAADPQGRGADRDRAGRSLDCLVRVVAGIEIGKDEDGGPSRSRLPSG